MNVVSFCGGLGNRMFQYAIYRKLIYLGEKTCIYDFDALDDANFVSPLKKCFGIEPSHVKTKLWFFIFIPNRWPDNIVECRKYISGHNFIVDDLKYREDIFTHKKVLLRGYWQSEKYFQEPEIQAILRKEFVMRPDYIKSEGFLKHEEEIRSCNAVSVHIRRGDYIKEASATLYGGICTDEYYEKAIKRVCSDIDNPTFFLFSNDKQYLREKYGNRENFRIVNNYGALSDTDEFFLMSYCRHHIIAHSSFSWWASYLNDSDKSMIVAPDRWMTTGKNEDIYRPKMIRIKETGNL